MSDRGVDGVVDVVRVVKRSGKCLAEIGKAMPPVTLRGLMVPGIEGIVHTLFGMHQTLSPNGEWLCVSSDVMIDGIDSGMTLHMYTVRSDGVVYVGSFQPLANDFEEVDDGYVSICLSDDGNIVSVSNTIDHTYSDVELYCIYERDRVGTEWSFVEAIPSVSITEAGLGYDAYADVVSRTAITRYTYICEFSECKFFKQWLLYTCGAAALTVLIVIPVIMFIL